MRMAIKQSDEAAIEVLLQIRSVFCSEHVNSAATERAAQLPNCIAISNKEKAEL